MNYNDVFSEHLGFEAATSQAYAQMVMHLMLTSWPLPRAPQAVVTRSQREVALWRTLVLCALLFLVSPLTAD